MSDSDSIRRALGGFPEKEKQSDNVNIRDALNDVSQAFLDSYFRTPFPESKNGGQSPIPPKPVTPKPTTTPVIPPRQAAPLPTGAAPSVTGLLGEIQNGISNNIKSGQQWAQGLNFDPNVENVIGGAAGIGNSALQGLGALGGILGAGVEKVGEGANWLDEAMTRDTNAGTLPANYKPFTEQVADLAGQYNERIAEPVAGIASDLAYASHGASLLPTNQNIGQMFEDAAKGDWQSALLGRPQQVERAPANNAASAIAAGALMTALAKGDVGGAIDNALRTFGTFGNEEFDRLDAGDKFAASLLFDPLNFIPGAGVHKLEQASKLGEITKGVGFIEKAADLLPASRIKTPMARMTEAVKSAMGELGRRTIWSNDFDEVVGTYRAFEEAGKDADSLAAVMKKMTGIDTIPAQRLARYTQGMGKIVDEMEQGYRATETFLRQGGDATKLPETFTRFLGDMKAKGITGADAEVQLLELTKAEMAERTKQFMAEALVKLHPKKGVNAPVNLAQRFMNNLKAAEALVYIGLSPFTFIRNYVNGLTTMAIEGVNPLWDAVSEINHLKKIGQPEKALDLQRALKYQEVLNGTGQTVRQAFGEGGFATAQTGAFGSFMSKMLKQTKLGKPLEWYQNVENAQRAQVWSHTYWNALAHNWTPAKAMPKFDAGAEAVFHQYGFNSKKLTDILEETGPNPAAATKEVNKYLKGLRGPAPDWDAIAAEMGMTRQQAIALLDKADHSQVTAIYKEAAERAARGEDMTAVADEIVAREAAQEAEAVAQKIGVDTQPVADEFAGMSDQDIENEIARLLRGGSKNAETNEANAARIQALFEEGQRRASARPTPPTEPPLDDAPTAPAPEPTPPTQPPSGSGTRLNPDDFKRQENALVAPPRTFDPNTVREFAAQLSLEERVPNILRRDVDPEQWAQMSSGARQTLLERTLAQKRDAGNFGFDDVYIGKGDTRIAMPDVRPVSVSDIQAKTHSLQDVIDGRVPVGVEGRGGQDFAEAKQRGMFTASVGKTNIFANNESSARPLIDYLNAGGKYGTPEFSKLLGYTDAEIAEYRQFLGNKLPQTGDTGRVALSKQHARKDVSGDYKGADSPNPLVDVSEVLERALSDGLTTIRDDNTLVPNHLINALNAEEYQVSKTPRPFKNVGDIKGREREAMAILDKRQAAKAAEAEAKATADAARMETAMTTRRKALEEASKMPRHEYPHHLSENVKDAATELKFQLNQGSAGKRVSAYNYDEGGRNFMAEGSSNAPFYKELFAKYKTNKPAIESALEKIIKDKGADKGVSVERVKEYILQQLAEGLQTSAGKMPPDWEARMMLGYPREKIDEAWKIWDEAQQAGNVADDAVEGGTSGITNKVDDTGSIGVATPSSGGGIQQAGTDIRVSSDVPNTRDADRLLGGRGEGAEAQGTPQWEVVKKNDKTLLIFDKNKGWGHGGAAEIKIVKHRAGGESYEVMGLGKLRGKYPDLEGFYELRGKDEAIAAAKEIGNRSRGQEPKPIWQAADTPKAGQEQMFTQGEDSPLFSGTPMTAKESAFIPEEQAGTQGKMFSTAPEFGAKKKKPTGFDVAPVAKEIPDEFTSEVERIQWHYDKARATLKELKATPNKTPDILRQIDFQEKQSKGLGFQLSAAKKKAGKIGNASDSQLRGIDPMEQHTSAPFQQRMNAAEAIDNLRQVTQEAAPSATASVTDEMVKAKAAGKADLYDALLRVLSREDMRRAQLGTDVENRVNSWLRKSAMPAMDEMRQAAIVQADWMDNAVMISRDGETHFDAALGVLSPFQFWRTRFAMQSMRRVMDKPARLAWYLKLREGQDQVQDDPRFPKRLRGMMQLPHPLVPAWAGGGMWFDPLEAATSLEGAFGANRFEDEVQDADVAEAIRVLAQSGEISLTEASNVVANQSGALWDQTKMRLEELSHRTEGIDAVSDMFRPHLPFDIIKKLQTGNAKDIGVLFPMTRLIRGATGVNIEQPIKAGLRAVTGAKDIPDWDMWDLQRTDRALADMVGDGLISERDAMIAMIERKGTAYEQAQQRAQQQMALQSYSVFGGQLFPEGEKEYYKSVVLRAKLLDEAVASLGGNPDDYSTGEKWDIVKANGLSKRGTPLGDFYKNYPVYDARNSVYDEPEARLKEMLADEIWGTYNNKGKLDRKLMADDLGEQFKSLFLSGETRDMSAVTLDDLGEWTRKVRGYVPEQPILQVGEMPEVRYGTLDQNERYTSMQDTRDSLFNMDVLGPKLNAYSNLSKEDKRAYRDVNNDVDAYLDWYGIQMRANPDLSQLLSPDYQASTGSYVNARDAANDITRYTTQNLDNMIRRIGGRNARGGGGGASPFVPTTPSGKPPILSNKAKQALAQRRKNPRYFLPRDIFEELLAYFRASGARGNFNVWLDNMVMGGVL